MDKLKRQELKARTYDMDIRQVLADNAIKDFDMDIRQVLCEGSIKGEELAYVPTRFYGPKAKNIFKLTIPRTGYYQRLIRIGVGEYRTQIDFFPKDTVIDFVLDEGNSITLMPDTAKGKPMRCYAINISVPTIEPLDIVPPYQVLADGRVDKPEDDRPIFQQFSTAKDELVKLLQVEREKVNSQIKAVRKLTRGKINAMAEAAVAAAPEQNDQPDAAFSP